MSKAYLYLKLCAMRLFLLLIALGVLTACGADTPEMEVPLEEPLLEETPPSLPPPPDAPVNDTLVVDSTAAAAADEEREKMLQGLEKLAAGGYSEEEEESYGTTEEFNDGAKIKETPKGVNDSTNAIEQH